MKNTIQNITKTILYLQMTAMMFVTTALAGPAAAENQVPFRGSLEGVEIFEEQFPTLFVEGSGIGNATQLGRFTATWDEVVNLLTLTGIGSAHFIAANGDSIFTVTEVLDPPQFPQPDVLFATVTHTITGGTGRFAGATGSFTEERLINLVTGVISTSFDGTIVIH